VPLAGQLLGQQVEEASEVGGRALLAGPAGGVQLGHDLVAVFGGLAQQAADLEPDQPAQADGEQNGQGYGQQDGRHPPQAAPLQRPDRQAEGERQQHGHGQRHDHRPGPGQEGHHHGHADQDLERAPGARAAGHG
jgi:hypothetical protein